MTGPENDTALSPSEPKQLSPGRNSAFSTPTRSSISAAANSQETRGSVSVATQYVSFGDSSLVYSTTTPARSLAPSLETSLTPSTPDRTVSSIKSLPPEPAVVSDTGVSTPDVYIKPPPSPVKKPPRVHPFHVVPEVMNASHELNRELNGENVPNQNETVPPPPPPPPGAPPPLVDQNTPRVTNSKLNTSFSDAGSSNASHWSVDHVAASVNHAFSRLRDLAFSSEDTEESPMAAPEGVNTSSSSSEHDEPTELNLKELVREIQQGQTKIEQAHDKPENQVQVPNKEQAGNPNESRMVAPAEESKSNAHTSIVAGQAPSFVSSSSRGLSSTNTSKTDFSRAMTPIMRMRNTSLQEEVTGTSDAFEKATTQLADSDFLQAKQRKWKEKMREVERKKERLRREKRRKPKHGKAIDRRRSRGKRRGYAPGLCAQDGVMGLVDTFWSSRCGNLDDSMTVDDDSMMSDESRSTEEGSIDDSTTRHAADDVGSSYHHDSDTSYCPPSYHLPDSAPGQVVGIGDKNFILSFIANAKEKGIQLIAHKRNRRHSLSQPLRVKAFIRSGEEQMNGQFCTPCLEWQTDRGLFSKKVDLFDIKSFGKASALQLELYPLAMPGRSVLLRTNGGSDYVFETRDEATALQFVHGMRWVIARFTFNLVIGNLNVSSGLLDVDEDVDAKESSLPATRRQQVRWSRAMNDATNSLVEKSTFM